MYRQQHAYISFALLLIHSSLVPLHSLRLGPGFRSVPKTFSIRSSSSPRKVDVSQQIRLPFSLQDNHEENRASSQRKVSSSTVIRKRVGNKVLFYRVSDIDEEEERKFTKKWKITTSIRTLIQRRRERRQLVNIDDESTNEPSMTNAYNNQLEETALEMKLEETEQVSSKVENFWYKAADPLEIESSSDNANEIFAAGNSISLQNNKTKYKIVGVTKILPVKLGVKTKKPLKVVKDVHELRQAVLNDGFKLEQLEVAASSANGSLATDVFDHEVLKLIENRVRTNSKPGNRAANDTAKLALSIEGGGMRGSISAGMAAAIATLGLCDAFDSIYGSSAGSVVGAYMISRQMCVDVYTDLLPAARELFVSKVRLASTLVVSMVGNLLSTKSKRNFDLIPQQSPAMNISFVLDSIMDPETGLRPLDSTCFQTNDKKQSLRVVSSVVHDGEMQTVCFGSKEGDYFDENGSAPTLSTDGSRRGLLACLQASMTVPGATGPPVNLNRKKHRGISSTKNDTSACFDAFCFEPLPYRSAVEEGATHVLVLRSRPEGCVVKTKPGIYEKTVAPIYFNTNGFPQVAKYFEEGGQQYRYLEDIMTLDEGKTHSLHAKGVLVPPTKIYYGVNATSDSSQDQKVDTSKWNRAHLLPITVPNHKGEMPTLENGKDEVLQAVRDGFAAAFDTLAPIVGLELDRDFSGDRVAELVFPKRDLMETILQNPVVIPGDQIIHDNDSSQEVEDTATDQQNVLKRRERLKLWLKKLILRKKTQDVNNTSSPDPIPSIQSKSEPIKPIYQPTTQMEPSLNIEGFLLDSQQQQDAFKLLTCLPGLQAGKFTPLSTGLQMTAGIKMNA